MSLSILIVDESTVARHVVERAIEISGIPVATCLGARHGKAALEILETQKVDLIVTDTQMSEMNGEELVNELQAREPLRNIPFIVVSADTTATRVQNMLEKGAAAYIAKPFAASTLRTEISRTLKSC